MNYLKNSLKILLACSVFQIQALPEQAIMLLLRDINTNQVIYDTPIQATYGGFFTNSNHNGQIILPRKTQALEFYILITTQIIPVFNILNNISHLQIMYQAAANMYHITTIINPETDELEWLTSMVDIPQDRHIPLHTIVIFADPANMTLQTGTSSMLINSHLILPNLYLNNSIMNHDFSLSLPNIRPLLGKLETAYALTPYGYATIQTR